MVKIAVKNLDPGTTIHLAKHLYIRDGSRKMTLRHCDICCHCIGENGAVIHLPRHAHVVKLGGRFELQEAYAET